MGKPLTVAEREILTELAECQDTINDKEYTEEQREVLRSLEQNGLVHLCWVLRPAGKRIIEE